MKKAAIIGLIAVILTFSSCDDFFRSSWGKSRTYDASKINVNADNIDEWVAAATGNPELADAIAEAILQKLKGSTNEREKAKLLEGGIKIAVESSGLGESLLARGAELLANADDLDEDTVTKLLDKIMDDFLSNGGVQSADYIAEMLEESISTSTLSYPHFSDEYANAAQAGDIAEAILVLILGEAGRNGVSLDDPENWSELGSLTDGLNISGGSPPHVVIDGSPSPTALALAAYLNLISDQSDRLLDNPLTNAIYEAFFQ